MARKYTRRSIEVKDRKEFKTELIYRLHRLRCHAGMTQEEFAKRIMKVSRVNYSKYENEKETLSAEKFRVLLRQIKKDYHDDYYKLYGKHIMVMKGYDVND